MTSAPAARRPSGRPTAAGAAELAERILKVATRAFLTHGYAATSIETIAASAGVAKRTLYARWRGKPALFRAVLERLMARWLAMPGPPPPASSAPQRRAHEHPPPDQGALEPPAAQVDRLEAALLQTATRVLAVALQPDALALHRLMIAESGRFPELAEMVRQTGAAAGMARIADLLAAEMLAGRLAPLDPETAAEQFLTLVLTGPQRRALGLAPSRDPRGRGGLGAPGGHAVPARLPATRGTPVRRTPDRRVNLRRMTVRRIDLRRVNGVLIIPW